MPALAIPKGVDPKLTENYLLDIPTVTDASVWWSDGRLYAHVTTFDPQLTESDLKHDCLSDIGIHQTPQQITLVAERSFAA
ncbi:MAG: hypothetical protein K1X67_04465 [Fimbriimonadaceae bacterium]|nr:hypothetical protein [Fimbriimonadaceae bacterium]